ncbi:efflux RND transporter periplasmic adaptor subunit [Fulvivirgaceae bacterium BMA12]|uniref:Efflux RND transporter periplasmic adaptor subunit n=1 Tax=Agaribacillus aureus TaxID=3051825 RepID=A0ABT8LID6_9BACT|nr:efflux RND transporter periplasmic adaptor subunit [Fulvivirgaceae bacterium BMA12]
MKRYIYPVAFITLSYLTAGCGGGEKATIDNTTPIAVKTQTVLSDNSNTFIPVSGKIQAANSANLSTRMMGFVNKIHVSVGEEVHKGQLLMSINNADLQAKRAQVEATIIEATAAYKNAEKDYRRFQNLLAQSSATPKEMDDMTANFEMARARLEAANQMKNEINAQFTYANITAPFDGIVTNRFIEQGDMANPGTPLMSLEAPRNFEVHAMVPESEISKIAQGVEVEVLVKSINQVIRGTVTEISTSSKNTGGQFMVKAALDKTAANMLSGMFATVRFPVNKKAVASGTILIPSEAIVTQGQLAGVYTVSQSNTAILRWLRLGRTFGDQVEVLSGLSTNESYIISADSKLYNGAKISIP